MELVLCGAGAFQVCISRISGICIGVGVSLLLSIIIYPSSASVKAMSCLRQVITRPPFFMQHSFCLCTCSTPVQIVRAYTAVQI